VRGQRLAEQRVGILDDLALAAPCPPPTWNAAIAPTEIADQASAEHDDRERHAEEEDQQECQHGQPAHDGVLERAAADPHHRLQHDRQHRALEAEEQAETMPTRP
jgi:hypothetical protein